MSWGQPGYLWHWAETVRGPRVRGQAGEGGGKEKDSSATKSERHQTPEVVSVFEARFWVRGWQGVLSMHTICQTNLQASLKTVGEEEEDFFNFLLRKSGEMKIVHNLLLRIERCKHCLCFWLFFFFNSAALFYFCDHRNVCKYFSNGQIYQPFVPWSVKKWKTEPGLAGLTAFHRGLRGIARGSLNRRHCQAPCRMQWHHRFVIESGHLTSKWCSPHLNVSLSPQLLFTMPEVLSLVNASEISEWSCQNTEGWTSPPEFHLTMLVLLWSVVPGLLSSTSSLNLLQMQIIRPHSRPCNWCGAQPSVFWQAFSVVLIYSQALEPLYSTTLSSTNPHPHLFFLIIPNRNNSTEAKVLPSKLSDLCIYVLLSVGEEARKKINRILFWLLSICTEI